MSVEIGRPIEEVFDYTVNNAAEWSLIVVEEKVGEKAPVAVGSTFTTVTEERGRRMEFAGVVTRHDPPTAHSVVLMGEQFGIEADYLFERIAGGTRVTQRSTVSAKGLLKVMFLLLGWLMRKSSRNALERELSNLKRIIEERGAQNNSP